MSAEAGAHLEAILRPFHRIAVSKLLAHLDSDHETEDFVRVEGGEYSSHFIVNEVEAEKHFILIHTILIFRRISPRA